MKPLISVVTPSWNQGRYIADCIGSVKAERPGLVEHLIVDNCSDDETSTVLAENPHVRAIVEKDKGQSDGLNRGIALAQGAWILWLNADDYLLPGMLQRFVEWAESSPSADVAYGHTLYVDASGSDIRTLYQVRWAYYMIQFGLVVLPTSGTLFRTSLLKKCPLDTDFHIVMDSEWCLRNGRNVRVERFQTRSMAFRVTDENKTSVSIRTGNLTPRHAEERKVLALRYPFYGKAGENEKGMIWNLVLSLLRKGIRIRILLDKAYSRLLVR